jgi:hypothetical protein
MTVQTITTRYFGATNTRGAYIKGTPSGCPRRYVKVPSELLPSDDGQAHAEVARRVATMMGWGKSPMVGGQMPEGSDSMVWVFDDPHSPRTYPRPVFSDISLAEACLAFVGLLDQAGPKELKGARAVLRGMNGDMAHPMTLRKLAAVVEAALREVR